MAHALRVLRPIVGFMVVSAVLATPAGATIDLRPPVEDVPSVHEVPLAAPSGTSAGDTTTLDDARSAEDSAIEQDDSDLSDGTSSSDQAKELEDILKKCLAGALASLAASYLQGQAVNFTGTLSSELVSCLKENIFGAGAAISEENESAVSTFAADLTGQMDASAQPVIATGLSVQEFGSWLESTADSVPEPSTVATTTTTPPPEPSPKKSSSSPVLWIVIVIAIVVVVGGGAVLGKK